MSSPLVWHNHVVNRANEPNLIAWVVHACRILRPEHVDMLKPVLSPAPIVTVRVAPAVDGIGNIAVRTPLRDKMYYAIHPDWPLHYQCGMQAGPLMTLNGERLLDRMVIDTYVFLIQVRAVQSWLDYGDCVKILIDLD
jgi:hypothetical protein